MKLRILVCILALALVLGGCSAGGGETASPSLPPETTLPAETGSVPETTLPAETEPAPETTLPEDNGPTALAIGEYLVNEVRLDEGGVTNEDNGVRLFDDGSCMLYMGWGMWYQGSYAIANGDLVCACDTMEWDGGGGPGSRPAEVTFTFAIRSENLLELTDIACADAAELDSVNPYAFSVGMTYSIPEA